MALGRLQRIADPWVRRVHRRWLHRRRVEALAEQLTALLPASAPQRGLDVGCGDGRVARELMRRAPRVSIDGADTVPRAEAEIPVTRIGSGSLPFADGSFDFVMLVDVLHHTHDPRRLLRECARVARHFLLVKDHVCESRWDWARLVLMDWVGNRSYDAVFTLDYFSRRQWQQLVDGCGLTPEARSEQLGLYGQPLSALFDAELHFAERLAVRR